MEEGWYEASTNANDRAVHAAAAGSSSTPPRAREPAKRFQIRLAPWNIRAVERMGVTPEARRE